MLTRHFTGGKSFDGSVRGVVAKLEFEDLIASQSQTYLISITNFDLTDVVWQLPDLLSSEIGGLTLTNSLLTEFPSHLAEHFPSLTGL